MKQHKGNIILMVLFILVTASAFALLMMQYTQSMFDHTRMTYDYNKAYYLANAGVELGLADSLATDNDFAYAIGYENTYTDPNGQFGCSDTDACGLTGTIVARDTFHTDSADTTNTCTSDTAFALSGGASLAFPLFILDENKEIANNNHTTTHINIVGVNNGPTPSLDVGATVMTQAGNTTTPATYDFASLTPPENGSFTISEVKTTGSNPKSPSGKMGEYLVFINNNNEASFCIKSNKDLARQRVRVDSEGRWGDYDISLSASKKVTLPGFLFSTSVGR